MPQRVPHGQAVIPKREIKWMRTGENLVAETVARAEPLTASTLLPGWDRGMVLAHLAGNAAALSNLLHWARTGVETPMYASPQARDAYLHQTRQLSSAAILQEMARARAVLDQAVTDMPETAWSVVVRTNSGRAVAASIVPFMRVREVYIHAADLDAGTGFDAIPPDVRDALIDDVVASLSAKPECPSACLHTPDRTWSLGSAVPASDAHRDRSESTDQTQVRSSDTAALLAWLAGRSDGLELSYTGVRPSLPRWL